MKLNDLIKDNYNNNDNIKIGAENKTQLNKFYACVKLVYIQVSKLLCLCKKNVISSLFKSTIDPNLFYTQSWSCHKWVKTWMLENNVIEWFWKFSTKHIHFHHILKVLRYFRYPFEIAQSDLLTMSLIMTQLLSYRIKSAFKFKFTCLLCARP